MKNSILPCVIFLYLALNADAQSIRVDYLVNVNTHKSSLSTEIQYTLILRDKESIYFNPKSEINQFKNSSSATLVKRDDGRRLVQLDDDSYADLIEDQYYKNYSSNTMIFNDKLVNRRAVVSETLNLFSWKLVPNSDTSILDFKCQKATTYFRGRKYEAYFSSSAYSHGGPWKFDGLPGVILYARSIDNYFVLTPLQIIINYRSEKIINPYQSERDILTWDQFVGQFEDKLKKILKQLRSDPEAGSGSIKITDRIEDLGIKDLSFN